MRRVAAVAVPLRVVGVPAAHQRREYTPLWPDPRPVDVLAPQRVSDECGTLGAPVSSIDDVSKAVTCWMRFGNDPVLDGLMHPTAFSEVEDYHGTNLVQGSKEQLQESIAFWTHYYERKFLQHLRQARRSAANSIGTMTGDDHLQDEADRPETSWQQDTYFFEVAFLTERLLKRKVANLEQFEECLRMIDAPAYLKFYDNFLLQTQTLVPLPSASVWHYEGDRRKDWAERYKPKEAESIQFFREKLGPALANKATSWSHAARQLAEVFRVVAGIQQKRLERQTATGIRKPWESLDRAEKDALALSEVSTAERSIVEDDFDAEDTRDTTEDWLKEQEQIHAELAKPVGTLGFSAKEFWSHTFRLEALSTEHVYTDSRLRQLAVAARVALYDAGVTPAMLWKSFTDSIEHSTVDLRSCVVIPQFNELWCRTNWVKFGASSVTQHTLVTRRQLQYYHAHHPKLVAAAAALYYRSKPLSSSLDYSSPYKYRRSLVALCAAYGVEYTWSLQRTVFGSVLNVGVAEHLIRRVVQNVAHPLGAARRQAEIERRQRNGTRLDYHKKSMALVLSSSAAAESAAGATGSETQWPFGSKRRVVVKFPSAALERFQRSSAAPGSVDASLQRLDLMLQGHYQVSLMRQLTAAEQQQRTAAKRAFRQQLRADVDQAKTRIPQLSDVEASAKQTLEYLSAVPQGSTSPATAAAAAAAQDETAAEVPVDEWEFVAVLDGAHPLSHEEAIDVNLPFGVFTGTGDSKRAEPLVQGTYRLRVRFFETDKDAAAGLSAGRNVAAIDQAECIEVNTAPFVAFDALPQLLEQFFGAATPPETFSGDRLVPLCQFLRDGGLTIPTKLEFEAGQHVNPKGEVYTNYLTSKIVEGGFAFNGSRDRYTEPQRNAEPHIRAHWALYHPGASEEEWQCARHGELERSFSKEKNWWIADDTLRAEPTIENSLSTLRYAQDVCNVLDAQGCSADGLATASYRGKGLVTALEFDPHACDGKKLEELLSSARDAIDRAHARHNTLSAAKCGLFKKSLQAASMLWMEQTEYGGKHGRTFTYAFDKALSQLDRLEGSVVDVEARKEVVDRFASSTHPEQRRKLFAYGLTTADGMQHDEIDTNRQSTWNNSV